MGEAPETQQTLGMAGSRCGLQGAHSNCRQGSHGCCRLKARGVVRRPSCTVSLLAALLLGAILPTAALATSAAAPGRILWRQETGHSRSSVVFSPDGQVVYTLDVYGVLVARNAGSGALLWETEIFGGPPLATSPAGNRLFATRTTASGDSGCPPTRRS